MTVEISGRQDWEHLEITQPKCSGKLDNVTCPDGVQIEKKLQTCQPVEVKSKNDLTVEAWH
jgi:hypothetical protein